MAPGDAFETCGMEIDPAQVIDFQAHGVCLIDVRDAEDYAAGHVEGAVHIPLAELEARLGEIPDDRVLVAICRVGGGRSPPP